MGPGIFRRRIRIIAAEGIARADLEDDLHRVGVVLRHDGCRITAVSAEAQRVPWSLCPQAAGRLQELVGMALSERPLAVYRHTRGPEQCTHMLDMAALAAVHAARGGRGCDYHAAVPVTEPGAPQAATLHRDGQLVLSWTVQGTTVTAPEALAGRDLRRILVWGETALDDQALEAVIVLRRAMQISASRLIDVDAAGNALASGYPMGGCYVYQPDRAPLALRNHGTRRDFHADAEGLLGDLAAE